jgi:peptidoglycan L-alanyl-D-glutamate endopeptidase CwlK
MPSFSKKSTKQLQTCHSDLQLLFLVVVHGYDCTVIEGHRNRHLQHKYFKEGRTELDWPHGKHNREPSEAVDVAPWIPGRGIVYKPSQVYHFAGWVMARAYDLHISIRWGGDWDRDRDVQDQSFNDLVHYELIIH